MEQGKLNVPSFRSSPPFSLRATVENQDQAPEDHLAESDGVGRDGLVGSTDNAAELTDVDGDIVYEKGVGYEATEEEQTPSHFQPPPPYFRRQVEEIKQLLSNLMPEKKKTGFDER